MTSRTDQIEADIDATRQRVSENIDEIRDRLSPGELLDQAMAYMKGGPAEYAGEFAGNLGRSVRDNPLPVLLLGVGAAWLMMSGGDERADRRRLRRNHADYDDGYDDGDEGDAGPYGPHDPDLAVDELGPYATSEAYPYAPEPPLGEAAASEAVTGAGGDSDEPGSAARTAAATRERARRAGSAAGETGRAGRERAEAVAEDATERAQRAAAGASHRARRTGGSVRRNTEAAYRRAGRNARYAGDRAAGFFDDQPVALAALAIAAGALLGGMIPQSGAEHRVLGPHRDRLRDEATARARHEAERAQRVAEAGREGGRREAEAQGLTPDGATESVKQAQDKAVKVAEAAEKEAEAERARQRGR